MWLAFLDQAFWRQVWRLPLTRMLLLSLSLHVAVAMLVQPRSYTASPYATVVIDARLMPERRILPVSPLPPGSAPVLPQLPASLSKPASQPPEAQSEPVAEVAARKASEPAPAVSAETSPQDVSEPVPRPAASDVPGLPSIPVMVDSTWYEARQLDVQPSASQPINPVYPPEAVQRKQQGTVKLRLKVDEFGKVEDVEVVEADPPAVFDDSALSAFRAAHFEPAQKDGRPVRSLIYIRVRYELNGP